MIKWIQDLNLSCVLIKMSWNSSKKERALVISLAQFGDTKVTVLMRTIIIRSFPRDKPGVPAWVIRRALQDFIEFAPEPKS